MQLRRGGRPSGDEPSAVCSARSQRAASQQRMLIVAVHTHPIDRRALLDASAD